MPHALVEAARHLSVDERVSIVEEMWDSIAEDAASLPVTDAQRKELDRRLLRLASHPGEGRSWEEVKARFTRQ